MHRKPDGSWDKAKLPSRHVTEGPSRAPHRSYLYAMGHEGMRSSLVSREVIADSVELTMRGHAYDALVGVAGCDKSLPGMMMAMLRLNVPSVFLYGGSIMPGRFHGKDVTVVDLFEGVGQHSAGKMDDATLC